MYTRIAVAQMDAAPDPADNLQAAAHFAAAAQGREPKELYEQFRMELDRALDVTAGSLDPTAGEEDLPDLALALALRSYADKLACQRVLSLLVPKEEKAERKKK